MAKKKHIPASHHLRDPEPILAEFEKYLDECNNHEVEFINSRGQKTAYKKKRIPLIEKFCARIDMERHIIPQWSKSSWVNDRVNKYDPNEYAKVEEYEALIKRQHEVAKKIMRTIYAEKVDGLLNGDGNPRGIEFDLKVNYKWNDKQVIEHQGKAFEVNVVKTRKDESADQDAS